MSVQFCKGKAFAPATCDNWEKIANGVGFKNASLPKIIILFNLENWRISTY